MTETPVEATQGGSEPEAAHFAPDKVDPAKPEGAIAPTVAPPIPFILTPFAPAPGLQMGIATQVQVWQGQFPPPEAVEHYERLLPGAFDRIIRMAELQQDSTIDAAAEARGFLRDDTRRGVWLGWSVTVGSLIGAVVCAFLRQPVVACALVAVPVMSVAKALVDSSRAPPAVVAIPQVTTAKSSSD